MRLRVFVALIVTILTAAVPIALIIGVAQASSAPTCTGGRWTVPQSGPDKHRAYVVCTKISSTTKVRPKLQRDLQSDIEGSWFTTTNVMKYSAYAECPFGCRGGCDWGPR